MLAGQRATEIQGGAEHVVGRQPDILRQVRAIPVTDEDRVQVAVSGLPARRAPDASRVVARVELLSMDDVPGGVQLTSRVTVEREGGDKPVCVAETISRLYF